MTTIIADYEAERRAILDLFQPECACRIVLLRGASGSGKSTLLRHCLENCPPQASYLSYDFKGDIPVAEVFYRAGQRLTWPRLPALTQQVAQMQEAPSVKVDSNWLAGINNRINVALHAESPADREHRRALLTNAFFDDLQAFDRPVVMVFDTFEKASTEVQRWLGGPVLARAAFINNVRVVIAGQEAPAPNIEWGHCCREHELYGVRDARHWLPVVQAMDRYIPFDDPMTWLAGLCYGLKGNPASIVPALQTLPRRESLP